MKPNIFILIYKKILKPLFSILTMILILTMMYLFLILAIIVLWLMTEETFSEVIDDTFGSFNKHIKNEIKNMRIKND